MTIPTKEPAYFVAGNTVSWNKTISDYSAASYLLSYTLVPLAGGEFFNFAASASNSVHQVRLAPADTAEYNEGLYQLNGIITDLSTGGVTTKITLDPLRVEVRPAASSMVDRRTFAETILEELKLTYKKLASQTIKTASVNGKNYTRSELAELRAEIDYWKSQVRSENGGAVRRVAVTFNKTS